VADHITPPGAQPMRRVLWFGLELHYWVYLAGALLFGGLYLYLNPSVFFAWRLLVLLCMVGGAVLLCTSWGGCRGDSWLCWGAAYLWQNTSRRRTPRAGPTLTRSQRSGQPRNPRAWWQEPREAEPPTWDEAFAEAEVDLSSRSPVDETAGWEVLTLPDADKEEAGWEVLVLPEAPTGTAQARVRLPKTQKCPTWPAEPGAAAAALVSRSAPPTDESFEQDLDERRVAPYDADALFLLDQGPCFAPLAGWTTPALPRTPAPHAPRRARSLSSDPCIIPLARYQFVPDVPRRAVGQG